MSSEAKARLAAAAEAQDRALSAFVLRSAMAQADETLADRRVFPLDDERSEAFSAALDAPPREFPRLRTLLAKLSPFDGSAN